MSLTAAPNNAADRPSLPASIAPHSSLPHACVLRGDPDDLVTITARVPHPARRDAMRWDGEHWHIVPALDIDGKRFETAEASVPRDVELPGITLGALTGGASRYDFRLSPPRNRDIVRGRDGCLAGAVLLHGSPLEGALILTAREIGPLTFQLRMHLEFATAGIDTSEAAFEVTFGGQSMTMDAAGYVATAISATSPDAAPRAWREGHRAEAVARHAA